MSRLSICQRGRKEKEGPSACRLTTEISTYEKSHIDKTILLNDKKIVHIKKEENTAF